MAMAGRHIRHDWQTFVNWEQKSVRTVCGKTSTFNAVGIPGVTEQPEEVEVKGKKYFGWCTLCAVYSYQSAFKAYDGEDMHPYIIPMYEGLIAIVEPVFLEWHSRQRR